MSHLTIRIEESLKVEVFREAQKLGIPVTLIVKNALKNFIKNPTIVIGDPEDVAVSPDIQKKMDHLANIL